MSLVVAVTGATRGLGRGIARGLASRGATVCVTDRDTAQLAAVSAEIEARGGKPLAIVCDHTDDAQVERAFSRIKADLGRLDILVNNAAAVYPELLIAPGGFWEKPLKLADMAADLAPLGVAAVSLWPGFILTDAVRAMPPEHIPDDLRASLPQWETAEFTGLVIDALYRDPGLMALSGRALIGAELGERYGIRDTDGKQPVSYRETMGAPAAPFSRAQGARA